MKAQRACLAVAGVLTLAGGAEAQIVIGPQVRVDRGNTGSGVEPTVAFVRGTMEALARIIHA
jgi:hypothetical protein